MPTLRLDESAQDLLCQQDWKGNIRQLRNVAEQMSILEKERNLKSDTLNNYLPNKVSKLPQLLMMLKKIHPLFHQSVKYFTRFCLI